MADNPEVIDNTKGDIYRLQIIVKNLIRRIEKLEDEVENLKR